MLLAHLVPGYFAGVAVTNPQRFQWNRHQWLVLWGVALVSAVAPDLDVIYNSLFNGFINHSTLWTHSIFVYLGLALFGGLIWFSTHWKFGAAMVGLVAIGGLLHLVLDAMSHGSPMFYPVSWQLVGIASRRVIIGGFWAYITDPIFLLEPLLLSLVVIHWTLTRNFSSRSKTWIISGTLSAVAVFSACFLILLPNLQAAVFPLMKF